MIQVDDWLKCYGRMWMKEIVPEAFCHPAKFSRALIRRIYAHAAEEEWAKAGGMVVDPFGGVGLGALEAMRRGMHWFGMELEADYCALAQQNIDLWSERYSAKLPNWGTATILQGDSCQLVAAIAQADLCLSSPPFASTLSGEPRKDDSVLGQMQRGENKTSGGAFGRSMAFRCGDDPANLGNLPLVTFWSASRRILEQVHQILIPDGHAIFVCKRFVRNGQIVEFPTQWARLCEAVGFEWLHHHRAWQTDDRGAQYTLDGELERRQITWQGFFRRDHGHKHPDLQILWEDVLCFIKKER